ncbi:hypothetical protein V6N12_062518 [Hibiscus sabdariffa]|uniref:Secreted protein n=1 Tax=Hibiscus sabdariffa TaxID=183260 RepID=A0ABR2F928_9ROSI
MEGALLFLLNSGKIYYAIVTARELATGMWAQHVLQEVLYTVLACTKDHYSWPKRRKRSKAYKSNTWVQCEHTM